MSKKIFKILAESACAISVCGEGDSRYALLGNL